MQIMCSAGKGQFSHEDCLQCALNAMPPCGFDYAILRSLFGDTSTEQRRGEIHVTDLTGCLLKSYYDKTDPSPEYVHEKMSRWMGSHMHGVLEGNDEHLDSELPLSWEGLVGRADVVYKDGRVLDFKTTRWLYPSKVPYGSHGVQVNIYAYLLRRMGRPVNSLQIQYIDLSGPTKCRKCRVPVRMVEGELKCPQCNQFVNNAHLGAVLADIPLMTDEEIEFYVKDRKEALQSSLDMSFPPEAEPGYLCSYCSHHSVDKCFPEER